MGSADDTKSTDEQQSPYHAQNIGSETKAQNMAGSMSTLVMPIHGGALADVDDQL